MKRTYSEVELQRLRLVKYLGPLTMLIIVFYILRTVFDLSATLAGLIALAAAAFEFVILSMVFGRHKKGDSDRIG